jgi:enoyl-CoA hydratase/carnithine racemase
MSDEAPLVAAKPVVACERRQSVLWLRIDRPAELNTINPQVLAGLNDGLEAAEADPEIRAVALTGTGRAFCAGADLKFVQDLPDEDRAGASDAFISRVLALMDKIERFPKPTLAAVNGIATGGGLELLLCCDLVIAAASARIGDGHANFGLIPGGGATVRLPRKIGPTRAKYLFFTGELSPAEDFVAAGLVNQVVAAEALEAAVDALGAKLAAKSPLALSRVKRLADDALEQSPPQGLASERTMSALHALSFDMREGVAAFNEKRAPRFQGR